MTLVAIELQQLELLHSTLRELKEAVSGKVMQDTMLEVMDPELAAKYLKMSVKTLHALKNRGEVKYSQNGRFILFRKSDLDEWILNNRVGRKK